MLGNWFKTTLLMAAIVVLFGLVGAAIGGMNGMMMALLIAAGMNFYAYWFSADMVLRMYNAQEITADNRQFSAFYHMVKELAHNAQLPMPKVYVIDEAQPNAFATGRNPENAAVAATTGIMQILNQNELRGVMAHELAHVKHRDTLISTISATIAGAISSIGSFGMLFAGGNRERGGHPLVAILVLILAPIAAMLIQMAISRAREFEADKGGAEISRDPASLASALKKIHNYAHQIPMETAEMHPETAQMMIINPLSAEGVQGLFSTHPQTEERIARLMAMVR
jgi:heat shock protein HtpX